MLSWELLKPDTLALICADLAEAFLNGHTGYSDRDAFSDAQKALDALVGQDESDRMIEEARER